MANLSIEPVIVKVPATSANCGPGFDCLGVACTLYNTFTYELIPQGFELVVEGEGKGKMYPSAKNLAFLSFLKLWNKLNGERVGLKIHMRNNIPLSRGLGSSSTAIVAGLMAANVMCGNKLNKTAIVNIASEIEGHPDNVAPAILGGFTINLMQGREVKSLKIIPPKRFKLIAIIPAMPLATAKARAVIPKMVSHKDAVFNVSRASMLVGALLSGNYDYLSFALEDKLHQPYRAGLIPGLQEAFSAGKEQGAFNVIISGAGSTIMAYAPSDANAEKIGEAMKAKLTAKGLASTVHILAVDTEGARIL